MGDLVSLGVRAWSSKGQWTLDNATAASEKVVGQAEIRVQNMLSEVNANIENALRGENNALLAARAALGNFQKSAKSEAILKAAGSKYNALGTNIGRVQDKQRADTLERRIMNAEQQGAMTAAFAATGTGGATQQMLKTAMAATAARRETRIKDNNSKQTYGMLAQQAGIMAGAVPQLDQGQVFVALDHTKVAAQTIIEPLWSADFRPTMEGQVWNTVGGQAGAVLGKMAGNRSINSRGVQHTDGAGGGGGGSAIGSSDWWESSSADLSTAEAENSYLKSFSDAYSYNGYSYNGYGDDTYNGSSSFSSYQSGGSSYSPD